MSMTQALLEQRIRRRESIKALQHREVRDIPGFMQERPPEEIDSGLDPVQAFTNELNHIESLKHQHLQQPKTKGGRLLRFSNLMILLLLVISGALFFVGGYIYSFINPVPGSSVSTMAPLPAQKSDSWRFSMPISEAQTHEQHAAHGYNERRQYLDEQQNYIDRLVSQGHSRSQAVMHSEARRVASVASNNVSSRIRKVVGNTLGNIFQPFANTIIQGTVGSALDSQSPNSNAISPGAQASATPLPSSQTLDPTASQPAIVSTSPEGNTPKTDSQVDHTLTGQSTPGTLFAVELKTFHDSTDAFLFMRNLKARGYSKAYVTRGLSGNTITFTVRIGNFTHYMDATNARKSLGISSRVVLATHHDDIMRY